MKETKIILISFLSMLLLLSCRTSQQQQRDVKIEGKGFGIEYAELLVMEDLGNDRTLCRILDPWRTGRNMMQYLLVPKDDKDWNEEVEETFSSKILCDTAFINASNIKAWMRSQKPDGNPTILDGGTATKPNVEVLMAGQSDALWISPYENATLGNLDRLPIPIIYCAEYMEDSPLARAEWMKFYGRLVGRGDKADSLFDAVATRYEKISNNGSNGKKILVDLPYGATWYVPGGCSASAQLYEDAGFVYPWADDPHSGSLSLSKEAVLSKAQDCDVWYIRYMDTNKDWTLADFKRQNVFFDKFKAAREGNVWGCNTAYSDFFDITSFRPDSLLESFVKGNGAFYKKVANK